MSRRALTSHMITLNPADPPSPLTGEGPGMGVIHDIAASGLPPPSLPPPQGGRDEKAEATSTARTGEIAAAIAALVLAAIAWTSAAEARCVKHVGGGGGGEIGAASAQALAAWVKDASKRSADAANWSKAKNLEVTCRKVIAGSGPARGPRWNCEATGSSSDVVGGENCPK